MSDERTEDDERERYATYCPACGCMYFEDEEGYDQDECFECGEDGCFEVPA